jgi:glyoxylase-like metal-dependent hydrolase (beta-lactamase superfamily II)
LSELGQPLEIIGGKDCQKVTKTPKHGETFNIGSIAVKALHTPCHTQDSICFFMQDGNDKVVFTGDTLFHGGVFALGHTLSKSAARGFSNSVDQLQAVGSSLRELARRCTRH